MSTEGWGRAVESTCTARRSDAPIPRSSGIPYDRQANVDPHIASVFTCFSIATPGQRRFARVHRLSLETLLAQPERDWEAKPPRKRIATTATLAALLAPGSRTLRVSMARASGLRVLGLLLRDSSASSCSVSTPSTSASPAAMCLVHKAFMSTAQPHKVRRVSTTPLRHARHLVPACIPPPLPLWLWPCNAAASNAHPTPSAHHPAPGRLHRPGQHGLAHGRQPGQGRPAGRGV